ncbi:acetyltransferase, GNAT family protein [Reticulibacter mediterranei]|uniref:Acetyltransferase, GNAT family protein n=1 Tax=Reticulibacter mediterranei TaxID=2778369 RepID=A0A8J3IKN1_9CHLR|nr:GNAT family N-acetyltransferase [Reticulibacter mediterranei]GHO96251.1 acetyltransferase, GNAT family protein [Reticulibacter mediterranei]
MLERRIEEAALNSWPALQQVLFDGWVIRFANGYTKRANSVTPVYPSSLPVQDKIAFCEQHYREQQQPTIFRLPSFSDDAQVLDDLLGQREYRFADLTLVLSTLLPTKLTTNDTMLKPAFQAVPLDEWLSCYRSLNQANEELQAFHRAILQHIVPQTLFAVYYEQDTPVACGVGVLEHEIFGLFDIITHPAQRRKGYGTQLVSGMLNWASERGASRAYLQVVSTNQDARGLYAKFGFQENYHYWYRIQTTGG